MKINLCSLSLKISAALFFTLGGFLSGMECKREDGSASAAVAELVFGLALGITSLAAEKCCSDCFEEEKEEKSPLMPHY